MCGRFTSTAPADVLAEAFGLDAVASDYHPSYNLAPTRPVPVVTGGGARRTLELFQWGLIPSWADRPRPGRLINARAETVATRRAFRDAFRKRRCLVLADGFYEWRRDGRRKIPMYIRDRSGRPFAMAGLWDCWMAPDGELVRTCAIVTTRPNRDVAPIHDRMPAILPADAHDVWLDHDRFDAEALSALLSPCPDGALEAYPVSPLVNSPANDSPRCIERQEPRGTLPLFPDGV